MYCVVCLKNNARDFFCPLCQKMVEKIFIYPSQIKVLPDTKRDYDSLSMEQKSKVIHLTNKRLGNILRAGLKKEFRLNSLIGEYTEMVLLKHNQLEIPVASNDDQMEWQSYNQYQSPHRSQQL